MRPMRTLDGARIFAEFEKVPPSRAVSPVFKGLLSKKGVRESKMHTPNVIKYTILSKICTFVPLQRNSHQVAEFAA
jgi:hypothetical protein